MDGGSKIEEIRAIPIASGGDPEFVLQCCRIL